VAGKDTRNFPVENVSWHDAVAFCRKLSEREEEQKAGRVYHLPTEAEWEYACRGGARSPFHYGNALSSTQANFHGDYAYGNAAKGPSLERTTSVGSYDANAFGLYDMRGNVWEWCADWYGPYPAKPVQDPTGPATGAHRVVRGGSWDQYGSNC